VAEARRETRGVVRRVKCVEGDEGGGGGRRRGKSVSRVSSYTAIKRNVRWGYDKREKEVERRTENTYSSPTRAASRTSLPGSGRRPHSLGPTTSATDETRARRARAYADFRVIGALPGMDVDGNVVEEDVVEVDGEEKEVDGEGKEEEEEEVKEASDRTRMGRVLRRRRVSRADSLPNSRGGVSGVRSGEGGETTYRGIETR
jgi:hypothetical protein